MLVKNLDSACDVRDGVFVLDYLLIVECLFQDYVMIILVMCLIILFLIIL